MKSGFFSALAVLVFVLTATAQSACAQHAERAITPTASVQVAMIFYRMTGQTPDFEAWAAKSDSYLKADPLDRPSLLRQKTAELNNIYDLISLREPIIVKQPVKLSAYSMANHGFFIDNFHDDTFFGYSFLDQHYAIVPQALMDHQWVSVESAQAGAYENILRARPDRSLMMYLEITPKSADKTAPLNLEGTDYWLILGEISHMRLFDPVTGNLMWESEDAGAPAANVQELLDLKQ